MEVEGNNSSSIENNTQTENENEINNNNENIYDIAINKDDSYNIDEYLSLYNSTKNSTLINNINGSLQEYYNNTNENENNIGSFILKDNVTYNLTSNLTDLVNSTNSTMIDNKGCELLGNFGYIVQLILAIMCFSILVCKILL